MTETSESAPMGNAQPPAGARMLHTMLRVHDLDRSLDFYVGILGMTLLRRKDYPDGKFTLEVIRPAGPMKADPAIVIAFIEDPDGYKVELIQTASIGL